MEALDFQLMAVSPVDGRYASRTEDLQQHVSEFGLIKARAEVMVGWVGMLGTGVLPDRAPLSGQAQEHLRTVVRDFGLEDARHIKEYEKTTNHDVKAVEKWVTDQLDGDDFADYRTMVHFGCTSEDVNSAAYALMLDGARKEVLGPNLDDIGEDLDERAEQWADLPMLALTHGQPATPTTLGKEMSVFAERLSPQIETFRDVMIFAKFSGATGGYNAAAFAYPEVDWPTICRSFIQDKMVLNYAPDTTQVEPHDWIARYLNEVNLANTILSDFAKDMWLYIQRGIIKQKMKEGEVGSSTMPHKVNPIDFENAEGNFDIAGGILQRLATSLPISRMQRDLSDSTRLRAIGPALAHSAVGYTSLIKGMGKISPNEERLREELDANWAVLTEAIQTVMRRYNIEGAYDRIKAASRGHELDREGYLGLVESLADELPEEAYTRLVNLTPDTYLGYQARIARGEV